MRTIQEIQRINQANTVEKAARTMVDQFNTRMAARNLGTVAHLPPALALRPEYGEDGQAIEFFAYGDECGSKPLQTRR